METKLVVLIHVNPISVPTILLGDGTSVTDAPGATWDKVYSGLRNAANIFVKYQDRVLSDGSGRQQVFSEHLVPLVDPQQFARLELSEEAAEKFKSLCARIERENDETPSAGLIIHLDVDQNKLIKGTVSTDMVADFMTEFAADLETLKKIKLFGCKIENTDRYAVNLSQEILKKARLPAHTLVSAFSGLAFIDGGPTPGQTSSTGYSKGVSRNVAYKPVFGQAIIGAWSQADIWRYSENRKKRPVEDLPYFVDIQLKRTFDTPSVKLTLATESIPSLPVALKTYEKLFLDVTGNKTNSAIVMEIAATQLMGLSFSDIQEKDAVDVWVIKKKRTVPLKIIRKSSTTIVLESKVTLTKDDPTFETTHKDFGVGDYVNQEVEFTYVRATPRGKWTIEKVEQAIDLEDEQANELSSLNTKASSLNKSIDRLFSIPPDERQRIIRPGSKKFVDQINQLKQKIKKLREEIDSLKKSISEQSNADNLRDRLIIKRELATLENEVKAAEKISHEEFTEHFHNIRNPQDKCLLELSVLIELLKFHRKQSASEEEKKPLKEMQNQVHSLFLHYRTGRDIADELTAESAYSMDNYPLLQKYRQSIPAPLRAGQLPKDVSEIRESVIGAIVAIQRQRLSSLSPAIEQGREKLIELEKVVPGADEHLQKRIAKWINSIRRKFEKTEGDVMEQQTSSRRIELKMNSDWQRRQLLLHDELSVIGLINTKIESLIVAIPQQQQTYSLMEKKFQELRDNLSRQTKPGESVVKWADELLKINNPDNYPGVEMAIKSQLVSIFAAALGDEELSAKISTMLAADGTTSISKIQDEIFLRNQSVSEDEVLKRCKSEFALHALSEWVKTKTRLPNLGGNNAPATQVYLLREALTVVRPEFDFPSYATDLGVDMIDEQALREAANYIKWRMGKKVTQASIQGSQISHGTTKEVLVAPDSFLHTSSLVEEWLLREHPTQVEKAFAKIESAFEEKRNGLVAFDSDWVFLQADMQHARKHALAQLINHFSDGEEDDKTPSESAIEIETSVPQRSNEETQRNEKVLTLRSNEQRKAQQTAQQWKAHIDGPDATAEEKQSHQLLAERTDFLSKELNIFTSYEKEFIQLSVEDGLLDKRLEKLQQELSARSFNEGDKRRHRELINTISLQQTYLKALIEHLRTRFIDSHNHEKRRQLVRAYIDLRSDEQSVWQRQSERPASQELASKLKLLKEDFLSTVPERRANLNQRKLELRSQAERLQQRFQNTKFSGLLSESIDQLRGAFIAVGKIAEAPSVEARYAMLNSFDAAAVNWLHATQTLERKLLNEQLRDALAWVKKRKGWLLDTGISDEAAGADLLHHLNRFESVLNRNEGLTATNQPGSVIEAAEKQLAAFKMARPALTLLSNLQLINSVDRQLADGRQAAERASTWRLQNLTKLTPQNTKLDIFNRQDSAWNSVMANLTGSTELFSRYHELPTHLQNKTLLEQMLEQTSRLIGYKKGLTSLGALGLSKWDARLKNEVEQSHQLPNEEKLRSTLKKWIEVQHYLWRTEKLVQELDGLPRDSDNEQTRTALAAKLRKSLEHFSDKANMLTDVSNQPKAPRKEASGNKFLNVQALEELVAEISEGHAKLLEIEKSARELIAKVGDISSSDEEKTRRRVIEAADSIAKERGYTKDKQQELDDWYTAERQVQETRIQRKQSKISGKQEKSALFPIEQMPSDDRLDCRIVDVKEAGLVIGKPGEKRRRYFVSLDKLEINIGVSCLQPDHPITVEEQRGKYAVESRGVQEINQAAAIKGLVKGSGKRFSKG